MNDDDETSAGLLALLGQTLMSRECLDAELAGIVMEHILTPWPVDDCVEQAMTAINELAAARVTPPKEKPDG